MTFEENFQDSVYGFYILSIFLFRIPICANQPDGNEQSVLAVVNFKQLLQFKSKEEKARYSPHHISLAPSFTVAKPPTKQNSQYSGIYLTLVFRLYLLFYNPSASSQRKSISYNIFLDK